MQAKLITPKCLQGCAHKLRLSWGFVGVGDDVAGILRDIFRGLLVNMGEKTAQQPKYLMPGLKEKKKVLSFSFVLFKMEL